MKRLYASLPNGEPNPEWVLVNAAQLGRCTALNPACHFHANEMYASMIERQIADLETSTKIQAEIVEYNAYTKYFEGKE